MWPTFLWVRNFRCFEVFHVASQTQDFFGSKFLTSLLSVNAQRSFLFQTETITVNAFWTPTKVFRNPCKLDNHATVLHYIFFCTVVFWGFKYIFEVYLKNSSEIVWKPSIWTYFIVLTSLWRSLNTNSFNNEILYFAIFSSVCI